MTPVEIKELQLGERVFFTGHLVRFSVWPDKVWRLVEQDGEGLVIGRRTLSNGHNVRLGEGEGVAYVPDMRFPVVLVAFALHRKPFVVPAAHVTRAQGRWARPSRPSPASEPQPLFALEDFS